MDTTEQTSYVGNGESIVNVSDEAAAKIRDLLQAEGMTDAALRIAVQPGGCSGLRYQMYFDERNIDGDERTTADGITIVIDRMSVPYMRGATIEYADRIEAQGFTIDNPNAHGTCACGDSFH